jgi:hypothetical protein
MPIPSDGTTSSHNIKEYGNAIRTNGERPRWITPYVLPIYEHVRFRIILTSRFHLTCYVLYVLVHPMKFYHDLLFFSEPSTDVPDTSDLDLANL